MMPAHTHRTGDIQVCHHLISFDEYGRPTPPLNLDEFGEEELAKGNRQMGDAVPKGGFETC